MSSKNHESRFVEATDRVSRRSSRSPLGKIGSSKDALPYVIVPLIHRPQTAAKTTTLAHEVDGQHDISHPGLHGVDTTVYGRGLADRPAYRRLPLGVLVDDPNIRSEKR